MLNKFFYSIAGKSTNETIESLIDELLRVPNLSPKDRRDLEYTKEVSKSGGKYPSKRYYYDEGYEDYGSTKSLQEITHEVSLIKDDYLKEFLTQSAINAINETKSSAEFIEQLRKLALTETEVDEDTIGAFTAQLDEEDKIEIDTTHSFKAGISDVDQITGGFQPGTMVAICAYTGEGKSTALVSMVFKNIKEGKHGALVSLEVAPRIIKMQLFSRYLYDVHSIQVTPLEMMNGSLSEDMQDKVNALKKDYNEFLGNKLLILDESFLSKDMLQDHRLVNRKYAELEKFLGVLNFVAYDHIGQIELMFKDLGNTSIRTFTSAGKTYINSEGYNPTTLMCVQANRQGRMRAAKRDGKYDLQAISDLNETERSCSYALFFFTSDDMKLLQETKITLLKHRFGALITEPVSVNFNASVFFVGEEVENVSFGEDFSFLNDSTNNFDTINNDDFDDFS